MLKSIVVQRTAAVEQSAVDLAHALIDLLRVAVAVDLAAWERATDSVGMNYTIKTAIDTLTQAGVKIY